MARVAARGFRCAPFQPAWTREPAAALPAIGRFASTARPHRGQGRSCKGMRGVGSESGTMGVACPVRAARAAPATARKPGSRLTPLPQPLPQPIPQPLPQPLPQPPAQGRVIARGGATPVATGRRTPATTLHRGQGRSCKGMRGVGSESGTVVVASPVRGSRRSHHSLHVLAAKADPAFQGVAPCKMARPRRG